MKPPTPSTNYYFFWHGPFSNWYMSVFEDKNVVFNCVEQYFMAHKALLFDDTRSYHAILDTSQPAEQKKLGRQVEGFNQDRWNAFKCMIMFRGCVQKFLQNPDLRYILLNTGNKIIVEASPYDSIWGIGFRKDHALANKDKWGQNLLGQTLMQVRGILKK